MRRTLVALVVLGLWPSTAAAKPIPVRSGTATIVFDQTFGVKLVTFGVTPGPIAPSTQDALTVTSPVRRGGHLYSKRRASIDTAGGVSQVGANFEILLQKLRFNMTGRTGRLSALTAINGLTTDRFTFASGRARSAKRTAGGYVVKDLVLKLNDLGAATLNSQLRTDQFAVGELIGVAAVTARR